MKVSRRVLIVAATLGLTGMLAGCHGASVTSGPKHADELTVVFIPSDSAKEEAPARTALTKVLSQATGKKVKVQTTTDYNVAISAIASGKAQIGLLGSDAYIQAHKQSRAVKPLVTYSGASGTLKDAQYRSFIMVPKAKYKQYQARANQHLSKIKGQKMSFVSATSTSGFAVPAGAIKTAFHLDSTDDLSQSGKFFKKVMYGGSHQASALNLLKGDADVAAFDDMDMTQYGQFSSKQIKPGVTFTVKADAPAPFEEVRGQQTVALGSYAVQNEPLVANTKFISKTTVKKIQDALTSPAATNNSLLFAPEKAKVRGLFTKVGKTHFVSITDDWYAPTHRIVGE